MLRDLGDLIGLQLSKGRVTILSRHRRCVEDAAILPQSTSLNINTSMKTVCTLEIIDHEVGEQTPLRTKPCVAL